VTLAGRLLDSAAFADPACAAPACPAVGTVSLAALTTGIPDGPQRLEVTVEDGAGRVTHILDRTVTVANTPPQYSSSVTLRVGSDPDTGPSGGASDPPGVGGEQSGCRSPQLAVVLSRRAVRIRRGVPLLAAGKRHRFNGRLTCRSGTRRVAAPRGTPIGLRHWVNGKIERQKVLRVGTNGRFSALVRVTGGRTLAFRARSATGKIVRVRIRVAVTNRGPE
jgi:hypothetical protein